MPSQTFIVRAHARTIYTKPVTFICAKCHQATTRECYPGTPPKYCLICSPKKKKASSTNPPEKGMFHATHHLIDPSGKRTQIALEASQEPGWYGVRTALDWFSGESIIQYHHQKGLQSRGVALIGYSLETLATDTEAKEAPATVSETISPQPYGHNALCKRFRCGDALLRKMRSSPEFSEWSRSRDPQGLTWEYRDGKYFPKAQAAKG